MDKPKKVGYSLNSVKQRSNHYLADFLDLVVDHMLAFSEGGGQIDNSAWFRPRHHISGVESAERMVETMLFDRIKDPKGCTACLAGSYMFYHPQQVDLKKVGGAFSVDSWMQIVDYLKYPTPEFWRALSAWYSNTDLALSAPTVMYELSPEEQDQLDAIQARTKNFILIHLRRLCEEPETGECRDMKQDVLDYAAALREWCLFFRRKEDVYREKLGFKTYQKAE